MYLDSVFPRKGRLLDIGCATGVFLDMARLDGWDVEGVEVSPELAAYAREKFSLNVHLLDLSKQPLGLGPFKVITMFDVIEHLPDARGMITACQKLLAPGGLLLIRTPTEEGLMRDVAKMVYWCSLKRVELPMLWFHSFEHIQSFSLKSMRRLLEERRFSILKIFREDESVERLNIPLYVKYAVKGVNLCSSAVGKQHKVCVIAKSG
jgi:SAM-dependent methyltransferase